jgi:hypothetical protein
MPGQPSAHPALREASKKTARNRKFGRRRLLSGAALAVGIVAVSTVGACGESEGFEFKPRREGITGAGST